MALSQRTQEILVVAMADRKSATEISSALNAIQIAAPAADVAAFGSTTNLPSAAAAISTSNTYSDAAVNAGIDAAVNTVTAVAETRLDNLETKVNSILTALKNAGLMS